MTPAGMGLQSSVVAGDLLKPAIGGFFVAFKYRKGSNMGTLTKQIREWLRLITDDSFAPSILAAVAAVCFLAFGLGATYDLVGGLLILGLVTAAFEAKSRAKNRR